MDRYSHWRSRSAKVRQAPSNQLSANVVASARQIAAAHQQAIQVGIAGSSKTEVLSGLTDGAQVITVPPVELTEGRRVRVQQP